LRVKVSFQRVEAARPQVSIGLDPAVDLDQRREPKPVQAPLRVDARLDQATLTERAQVLGDAGLAHAKLLDQVAHGSLAIAQQVEDPATGGLGNELERLQHFGLSMPNWLYACQDMR
jgi:hypothetical protein